jgi:hypothetical protein
MKGKTLTPSRGTGYFLLCGAVIFIAIGVWRRHHGDNTWAASIFFLLGSLNVIAAVQHLGSSIRLLPDRLDYGSFGARRTIEKERIDSVTWQKGCGVSLKMKDSSWIRIPDLGRAPGVCNSIRSWLKRTSDA